MDDDNNVGKSAPGLSPEQKTLLDSSEFAEFIEAEIKFRVHEELHQLRLLQVGGLGLILLVACVGLALTVNAYQRLQDTKAKNDRIALVMAQVEAVLKATGTAHQESGGE